MSHAFSLARRVRGGETLFIGWTALPEPLIAESLARMGYDAVAVDMQHGLHDPVSAMRAITGIAGAGKSALLRIPVGDFAMASRGLDMGAEAIIAPMVNTVADAEAFAAFVKYPPVGKRSWGPTRAFQLQGGGAAGYPETANRETLALAMIETREALDNVEAILAVPGIDGALVGPSDLSLTFSDGAFVDGDHAITDAPIAAIAEATLRHGKIAAIFAQSAARAKAFAALGYRIIAVGTDSAVLGAGVKAMLAGVRG